MESKFCHFRCVGKLQCGDPTTGTLRNASIPDEKMHLCRHCQVEACQTCKAGPPGASGPALERCVKCFPGYTLTPEGECEMNGESFFVAIAVVGALVTVVAVGWYFSVVFKPCVNQEGIAEGMEGQNRAMITMPHEPGEEPQPYPLSTNLLTTNVAGAGTMLFFRFQFALLFWAVALMGVWFGFVFLVSEDLMIIGNREAKSPQVLCAVVKWGRDRQLDLLWTKVAWLIIAYVFSVLGAAIYAILAAKLRADADSTYNSMADFVARLDGLPSFNGSERVEASPVEVRSATGSAVVGVSVAWDYRAVSGRVSAAIDKELELFAEETPVTAGPGPYPGDGDGISDKITRSILDAWHVHLQDGGHHPSDEATKQMLLDMKSTPTAFVVFESESAKKAAVDAVKRSGGILIGRENCTLSSVLAEPEEILWANLSISKGQRAANLFQGTLLVSGACLLWTLLLYLPYAFYMASFTYANGDEPGPFSEGIFITLVVLSQIGLFVCSSVASKGAGFHYEDQVHRSYTMFYNAALVLNLALDLVLQTYLSYLQMVGVGVHTADGQLLGSMTDFQDIFESYPMQKSLGKLLFKYCWPCTFFVPFLFEPVVAQFLPKHIAKILVGANPRIRGEMAEKAFELNEMEPGRYADIIFNLILVTCIPFIAPAYMAMTFGALIISHVYLYSYDRVKVLRYVGKYQWSSPEVHNLAQKLFSIPVCILAGALVFKCNQFSGGKALGSGVLKGPYLWCSILGAMVLHLIAHCCMLDFINKRFEDEEGDESTEKYETCAKRIPATHFSTNPVHCLRSKFILEQKPPQAIYAVGKEHTMLANPEIGSHYQKKPAKK
ncbi:unnamed protein product [Durusdinium trenchii]|uniref:Uncharacterized protein n=1 Tax=Durusdinium trenchii TaxID=1381693 RepID=A0ABP0S339_9DINO